MKTIREDQGSWKKELNDALNETDRLKEATDNAVKRYCTEKDARK